MHFGDDKKGCFYITFPICIVEHVSLSNKYQTEPDYLASV